MAKTKLRMARMSKGMSLTEFSELVRVNRGTLSLIETGRLSATPAMQARLCGLLGIDPRTVFDRNERPILAD